MYVVQREPARNSRITHPASLVRKHALAQAAVPGYCQEASASARSQSLGYTMESAGTLPRMPVQRVPDPEPDSVKRDFFTSLTQIIQGHIHAAAPNPQIGPPNNALWNSIKQDFGTENNIDILISKILSLNTTGVEDKTSSNSVYYENNYSIYTEPKDGKSIIHSVNTVFNGLGTPVSETLNDILYWTSNDNATSVSTIQLTDSDLHHRGVGVCIVDYQNDSGQKKIVVKPEDKTFDKTVYGKDSESLADAFNASLQNGSLGKTFKNNRIGTLGIQTSDNNAFGSAMEFFEHNRLNTMDQAMRKNIDLHSVESLIAFSSLLGLADLHVENAVYSQTSRHTMQLIDAEIGMKYLLRPREDGSLLQTALRTGEMTGDTPSVEKDSLKREDFENYNPDSLSAFMDKAKEKLVGKKSRIVLLSTPELFQYRSWYLNCPGNWIVDSKDYYTKLHDKAINYYEKPLVPIFMQEDTVCKDAAKEDFAAGRIPFFELHYSTGEIMQVLPRQEIPIVTYQGEDGANFLDLMIRNRKDTLTTEFREQRARKKRMITLLLSTMLASGAGLGLYYWFHKH